MGNISGKIDLTQLKHVIMTKKGKSGEVKGLFIPIAANQLFEGKNGNVYLDLICFDAPKPEFKQTHAVKQRFSEEERKRQKDAGEQPPFLGSLNANMGGGGDSAPQNAAAGQILEEEDDVPF